MTYYTWLIKNVGWPHNHHNLLFMKLYSTPFQYDNEYDESRAKDGALLRYRYFTEEHRPVDSAYDSTHCSMLEMMVALSLKMEENMLSSAENPDKAYRWFRTMLQSLRLIWITDDSYSDGYVENVLSALFHREYEYNGMGGLFTCLRPPDDMRKQDIWTQMCWYINEMEGVNC